VCSTSGANVCRKGHSYTVMPSRPSTSTDDMALIALAIFASRCLGARQRSPNDGQSVSALNARGELPENGYGPRTSNRLESIQGGVLILQ
jgi:hypothetical protein